MTELLFRNDAYLANAEAQVVSIDDDLRLQVDRTVFYGHSGGQPGDTGFLERENGEQIKILGATFSPDKKHILHQLEHTGDYPELGEKVVLHIDWARRYRFMRMHSALHLLSVVIPLPVTGGQIGEMKSRLDFNMPEAPSDKDVLTEQLNQLIAEKHAITEQWITDEELEANPGLVKTMSVSPPKGQGQIRLVRIGNDIDLQPCGGTHVLSTYEIGQVSIGKIENKGKQNRRVNLILEDS